MAIHTKSFRAGEDAKIDLKKWPTLVDPVYESKKHYKKLLKRHVRKLAAMQQVHYASNSFAVLFIFQAMDAAGKDGCIRHVMSGVNPQGCIVTSFKHPSAIALEHDFFWRVVPFLPERGHIGIFNRSYYEEVLIVRVHPEILASEGIPDGVKDPDDVWKERYHSMREFERHLHANGTRIVKFFLHLSQDEQRKRFLDRIDDPEKNWKFSNADIEERRYWQDYRKAYEDCIEATSTKDSPWYIVPADDKKNARLIVSQVILDTFESLNLEFPPTSDERRKELLGFRKQLAK